MLYDRPKESLFGLGIILIGFIVFLFDKKNVSENPTN
jgi:APA family basic amino acid/polyamine antiporter